MTDNVRSMSGATIHHREPVPEVVKMAEDLLEKARSGEVTGIAYVADCADGSVEHGFEHLLVSFQAVGKLHYIAHVILNDFVENADN